MIYSPLRYPGSKRRAMSELLPLFPDGIKDWREPFMGSLSVTLAFLQSSKSNKCERYIVGDLNPEIWYFWNGVKENPEEIYRVQKEWFNRVVPTLDELKNTAEDEEHYSILFKEVDTEIRNLWKEIATIDCDKLDPITRAARMYICNKISFSGLGDSGSLGPTQAMKYDTEKGLGLIEISELIKNVEFVNKPFTETVKDVTPDTFVFFDPPYYAQEGTGLYGRKGDLHKGFPHKEFGLTANSLKCKWMVTYDDSPYVRRMFRGKNIQTLYLKYSCSNTHREDMLDGEEIIITNYETESEMTVDI